MRDGDGLDERQLVMMIELEELTDDDAIDSAAVTTASAVRTITAPDTRA